MALIDIPAGVATDPMLTYVKVVGDNYMLYLEFLFLVCVILLALDWAAKQADKEETRS